MKAIEEEWKSQIDKQSTKRLSDRANRLFLPTHIEEYIDALKELGYDRDYLAILIVIGGHIGGLERNSKTERNGHFYLVKSIHVITKEILILTNRYSKDNAKTLNFSSKIKAAFESCNTFLF